MKRAIAIALIIAAVPGMAFAAKYHVSGTNGPVTVTSPYTGVVNKGNIVGGASTGLTVTGTAAAKVVNKGVISGSTGIDVTTTTSTTVVNTGTITSTGTGIKVTATGSNTTIKIVNTGTITGGISVTVH
jgi:hypothetical protein